MTRPETSGYIPFSIPGISTPASTWYKVVGDLNTQPALIALHGGPGAGHSYLSPLIDLYNTHGIPIVFYDQVGCGNSTHFRDRMGDSEFWTINLFIRELNNLVDSLRLRERGFSILGSSWGGLLAGAYSITQPAGLKKTVIASGPSDISLYAEGARELLRQLPDKVRKTIEECEKKGDFESPEYEAASAVFTKRHVCRLDPFPQDLMDTLANLKDDPTVYITM
jgi:proline-specific peptidase